MYVIVVVGLGVCEGFDAGGRRERSPSPHSPHISKEYGLFHRRFSFLVTIYCTFCA